MEMTPEQKYSPDGEFREPVLRCDWCQKIVLAKTLFKIGKCPHCGNLKVRNLQTLSEGERAWCVEQSVDPDFLVLFEPVDVPEALQ